MPSNRLEFWLNRFALPLCSPEDGGSRFLRNVDSCVPSVQAVSVCWRLVLWRVMPSSVEGHRRFGGTYCFKLHGKWGSTLHRNVGKCLPNTTASPVKMAILVGSAVRVPCRVHKTVPPPPSPGTEAHVLGRQPSAKPIHWTVWSVPVCHMYIIGRGTGG
jgi:hypothetical protein